MNFSNFGLLCIVAICTYIIAGSALPTGRRRSTLARMLIHQSAILPKNSGLSRFTANWSFGRRRRRYALIGSSWDKLDLTYRVTQYTPDLPRDVVDATIDQACRMWEAVTPLKFTRIQEGTPDIELMFVEGHHGDAEVFYGEGGRLAHAEGPMYGDIHFDDDETWTLGEDRGTNLLYVAVHELGHSLGLDHSNVKTAVMYPKYSGFKRRLTLQPDDIEGMQEVYPNQ